MQRIGSASAAKMWRLPNDHPTSGPTTIPPDAGEITASQVRARFTEEPQQSLAHAGEKRA